jgi:hypothetical protein
MRSNVPCPSLKTIIACGLQITVIAIIVVAVLLRERNVVTCNGSEK